MGKNVIISTLPNISQNYLPKVNTSNIFANSLVYDNGTNVMVNTTATHADYTNARLVVNNTGNSYLEVRGNGGQGTIALTTSTSTTSNFPTVEIFNSADFGIVGYRPGVVSSNYIMYYELSSSTNRRLTFQTEGVTRLTINQDGTSVFSSSVSVNGTTSVDSLTVSRNAADNAGGITLYNSNNQGYGSALTFRVNYAGVYNTSRIHGDWFSGNSGALHFFTANTSQALVERMIIDGSGNVGIGLTNPLSPLHAQLTDAGVGTKTIVQTIERTGASPSGTPREVGIVFKDGNNPTLVGGITGVRFNSGGNYYGGLKFYVQSSNASAATTFSNLTAALTLDYAGAATFSSSVTATQLSINTTTTDGRIDVRPNGISSYPIYWRNNNGGYGGGVYVTGGNNMQLYLANSAGTENVLIAASGTSFFNGGNVGIGTTSPATGVKLDVNGVIRAGATKITSFSATLNANTTGNIDFNLNSILGTTGVPYGSGEIIVNLYLNGGTEGNEIYKITFGGYLDPAYTQNLAWGLSGTQVTSAGAITVNSLTLPSSGVIRLNVTNSATNAINAWATIMFFDGR